MTDLQETTQSLGSRISRLEDIEHRVSRLEQLFRNPYNPMPYGRWQPHQTQFEQPSFCDWSNDPLSELPPFSSTPTRRVSDFLKAANRLLSQLNYSRSPTLLDEKLGMRYVLIAFQHSDDVGKSYPSWHQRRMRIHSKASISEPHLHCDTAQPSLKYGTQHQSISLILSSSPSGHENFWDVEHCILGLCFTFCGGRAPSKPQSKTEDSHLMLTIAF